ncbi:hypothetical protein ACFDR9_001104 [Janthinobacterium sp. CG_23.3]
MLCCLTMPTPTFTPRHRPLAGAALTLAIHLALLYAWTLSRPTPPPAQQPAEPGNPIQWLRLAPPTAAPALPALPALPARRVAGRPPALPRAAAATLLPVPLAATAPAATVQAAVAERAAPAPRIDDILQQAKRDVGAIDRQLRKAGPGLRFSAPANTPQTRLAKGFADAADAVPNRWFEAPKVQELIDPAGERRRRHKVVGAGGTYCVTFDGVQTPNGRDIIKNGLPSKTTNCPSHEQATTTQP